MDYYHLKTEKLLDFGVEKVIWITSKSKKLWLRRITQIGESKAGKKILKLCQACSLY